MPDLFRRFHLNPFFWRSTCAIALLGFVMAVMGFSSAAVAYDGKLAPLTADSKPRGMEGVGIKENLGGQLSLTALVTDENGVTQPLATYLHPDRPLIFSLVYYSCPGLCNFHMNGVVEALKGVDWNPGQKFDVVALSFDPKEGPELAKAKKATYVKLYDRPEAESGMHFLTASQATIDQLAKDVGFSYRWDEEAKEWAHASAAVLISPNGKISRYLHGIMFDSKDMKLGLAEASQGKIGTFVEKMVWYCFMYDPQQSKYTLAAYRLVQVGGGVFILILAALLIPQWLRSKRKKV